MKREFFSVQLSIAYFAVCLTLMMSACRPVALKEVIEPTKETPSEAFIVDEVTVWKVKWDNPVIQGTVTLSSDQFAHRKSDAWEYYKFDVTATTFGPVNDPTQPKTETLYTWPNKSGIQSGAGVAMAWEAHGMSLLPRTTGAQLEGVTTAQTNWNDSNPAIDFVPYGPQSRFQLDATVSVVPLRVVVLVPESSTYFSSGWFSEKDARLMFDDMWSGDKGITTNPGESPHDVVTLWSHKADCVAYWCNDWQQVQPDRVFDQCEVQFRMVDFAECTVPNSAFDNQDSQNPCNADLQVGRVDAAITRCEIPNDGIPKVIFLGSLVNNDVQCLENVEGGQKGNSVYIPYKGLFSGKYLIAHELGHLLELNDQKDSDVCEPQQLMCLFGHAQERLITEGQCITAKKKAISLQTEVWK